jgi:hypothetical protein
MEEYAPTRRNAPMPHRVMIAQRALTTVRNVQLTRRNAPMQHRVTTVQRALTTVRNAQLTRRNAPMQHRVMIAQRALTTVRNVKQMRHSNATTTVRRQMTRRSNALTTVRNALKRHNNGRHQVIRRHHGVSLRTVHQEANLRGAHLLQVQRQVVAAAAVGDEEEIDYQRISRDFGLPKLTVFEIKQWRVWWQHLLHLPFLCSFLN